MLYPGKIQILKLTDAGAHVLILALAVLILSPSLGRQRYLEELQPCRLTLFFTCYVASSQCLNLSVLQYPHS